MAKRDDPRVVLAILLGLADGTTGRELAAQLNYKSEDAVYRIARDYDLQDILRRLRHATAAPAASISPEVLAINAEFDTELRELQALLKAEIALLKRPSVTAPAPAPAKPSPTGPAPVATPASPFDRKAAIERIQVINQTILATERVRDALLKSAGLLSEAQRLKAQQQDKQQAEDNEFDDILRQCDGDDPSHAPGA